MGGEHWLSTRKAQKCIAGLGLDRPAASAVAGVFKEADKLLFQLGTLLRPPEAMDFKARFRHGPRHVLPLA